MVRYQALLSHQRCPRVVHHSVVTRISVDVNDEWLEAAKDVLGTQTKVATINEALRAFAVRKAATQIIAAFDSVPVDVTESDRSWGYNGGRDLSRLADEARNSDVA